MVWLHCVLTTGFNFFNSGASSFIGKYSYYKYMGFLFILFGFWTSDLNKLDKSGQTGAWVRETLEEATKTGTLGSFSAAPLVKGSLDGLIKSALEESAPPGETTALSWETVGSCAVGLVV